MPRDRTQLNINIDPQLLVELKSEAIKSGKTLTDFVVEKLRESSDKKIESNLEERLSRIEGYLKFNKNPPETSKTIGTIFTDQGAKEYGDVAKREFEFYAKKKGLNTEEALNELSAYLAKYPNAQPELVFNILLGTHQLTGLEMTIAYRNGSCAMRSALNDWTEDPLENLNKAFLNAVKSSVLK